MLREEKRISRDEELSCSELTPNESKRVPARALFALPVALLIAIAVHHFLAPNESSVEAHTYACLLYGLLGLTLAIAVAQSFWTALRSWMRQMCPILAAAILLLTIWETITSGFRLAPHALLPESRGRSAKSDQ